MATNLNDRFVTIDVIDKGSNRVLYSQEIPDSLVGRFVVLFNFNANVANVYSFRVKDKTGTVLKTL